MKTFVAHRFASTRCQQAKWVIVHDDDAVIRWKLLVDKLSDNTIQYNFNCLYSPPKFEFPMRYGRNSVARKFTQCNWVPWNDFGKPCNLSYGLSICTSISKVLSWTMCSSYQWCIKTTFRRIKNSQMESYAGWRCFIQWSYERTCEYDKYPTSRWNLQAYDRIKGQQTDQFR